MFELWRNSSVCRDRFIPFLPELRSGASSNSGDHLAGGRSDSGHGYARAHSPLESGTGVLGVVSYQAGCLQAWTCIARRGVLSHVLYTSPAELAPGWQRIYQRGSAAAHCAALAFVFLYVEKVDGRRVAQLKAAFDSLVTEYGGVPRRTLTWLDAWWAGPITHEIAVGGWAYHALEFRRHGYNSLLVADTLALKGQQARIVVLLPAWIPGVSEPQASSDSFAWLDAPRAREIHQLITSRGFDVEVVAPGIIASATRDRVDYFRRYPRRAAELAAVVIDVADLAKAIGAQSLDEALSRMREPGTPFGPEASSEQGNS